MKSLRFIIPILVIVLLGAAYLYLNPGSETEQISEVKTSVKKGAFKVKVTATGELQAKRSEKIRGPQGMRSARIYQTTLSDIVAEGTIVKAGQYVATLDRSELDGRIKDRMAEIEQTETQLEQTKIDTAIELRELRDQLVNLKFAKEEKLLQVEQNRFEPQSVIQQTQIDLQKTERDYKQLQKKYELTQIKSQAQVAENLSKLKQDQAQLTKLLDLGKGFVINAPKDGMVIYARSWDGKIGPGSTISAWNPVVAELPDLSDMVSKTYVNEVDISKVKKGQDVEIKVDAFPENDYTGQVIKVANIGEQLRGYDSKVFEVIVQVNEVDSILRPAMTTGIEIIVDVFESVNYIPLEGLFKDSLSYVFKEEKGAVVRQEVVTGDMNDDEIIVALGLNEGDNIYLSRPNNAEDLPFRSLDPKEKEKIVQLLIEDRKKRAAIMREKMSKVKDENIQLDDQSGGGMIIF